MPWLQNKITMTEKDKQLIKKAWKTSCFDWPSINGLIVQAETQEAKKELASIRNHKYHMEEAKNGSL